MSGFMWIGGNGTSKYLPDFGDKPTNYQKETSVRFIEQFTGVRLEERILNVIDIDLTQMKTGDILIGRRFTGEETGWMLLEGGYASHAAVVYQAPQEEAENVRFVLDCPSDLGIFDKEGGARITELNEWLGHALA